MPLTSMRLNSRRKWQRCVCAKRSWPRQVVKIGTIGTSRRDETLQIGYSRPNLAIQVYDKGQEITDISGKTWMYKVWEREGYYPPEKERAKDIWRVEIRFGKDFIKNRGFLTFDDMEAHLAELLAEALITRRLVRRSRHRLASGALAASSVMGCCL